jgi:hemolysin III
MQFLDLREPVNAWSHGAWLVLSVPGTFLLWRRSVGNRGKQLSLLIFGMSLAVCYSCSTIYHAVQLPRSRIATYALMDYIGIYILIAGTYTPIAWNLLQGRWRRMTLTLAWGSAAAGIVMNLAYGGLPPAISTGLYLAMGWGAIFCYAEMARTFTHRRLQPILAGGIAYSVGAVFYLLQWPVLWPGIFADHELFHLLVMAGSLSHYWFARMALTGP